MATVHKRSKAKFLTTSTVVLVLLVLLFLTLAYGAFQIRVQNTDSISQRGVETDFSKTQPPQTQQDPKPFEIKDSVLLEVPFTPQAPTANWDELHNDACEEASAIMAAAYFSGKTEARLNTAFVETEIDKLTRWQQKNYEYFLSITTEETAKMIESVYGLRTQIKNDFTENDIKTALTEGKLVILPANGQLLGNPNFKQPGPIYHMLVIIGYDEQGFITNDPGTRNGKGYRYSFDTLFDSAAEWNHALATTDTKLKSIILVSK